ncbi:MAG: acyl-CoA dehydrogenase family protein [Candidatus Eisenbacteria bacterium]|nr:acyl-CoA dehydrogenase family protein [Candidatus Eisenbacteria bacterium]
MDFTFSAEQEELARAVRDFAQARLNEDLIRRDREAAFNREGWTACAEMGLQGLHVPEAYGGQGQDLTTTVKVCEALGEACHDNGLVFSLNAQIWSVEMPILHFGTEEQKQRYLRGMVEGRLIGAHGMSEPDSGSDALAMRARAVKDGDHYVLDGTKTFITNGPVADFAIVFANVRPELKALGITAFLIDRDMPGVSFGPKIEKMGLRTSPMGEIILDNVRIPATQRLAREGAGMQLFNASMEYERAFIFASHLGTMRRIYERCRRHARERKQFGQSISKFTPVADKLIQMRMDIELARLLLYKIAWAKDHGQEMPMEAAMAKLFISEAQVRASLDAIQIFGGYGFTVEYEVEREHRDAIGGRLYSGTSEIQRKLIGSYLGL